MNVHLRAPWKRQQPIRKWWRCAECGWGFPSSSPGCQEHPKVLMYEWTDRLAGAYRSAVTRLEAGETEREKADGHLDAALEIGWRLAKKWRGE